MAQACSEDKTKRLFIIGVIHRDDRGAELLNEWLSTIAPEVITLEFSNYGLAFRKERGVEYKRRLEEVLNKIRADNEPCNADGVRQLFAYINMPYEYEIASRYSEDHKTPLHLVDMDGFSYLKLQQIDELFEEKNIRKLLCGEAGPSGCKETVIARLFFEKGMKVFTYTDEMYIRDKYVIKRLSLLMKHHKQKRFLHVCGWQHLQDPYGLYTRFNPEKAFIYDKTFCL
jgi:hypothetical protein